MLYSRARAASEFDVSQDLAFDLDCEGFKWRWDTYLLGRKTAAEALSKQLIMPLISMTHLAFYSADPVSDLAEADLEKASRAPFSRGI